MVLPPTLHRHELAKSIHAAFLYPTARLPPIFDAVASGARRTSIKPEAVLRQQHGSWERTRSATDARPNHLQKRVLPALFHLWCPSQSHKTFRPWTHTSDDSYIYQLSLVVATATDSFRLCVQLFLFYFCLEV